MRNSFWYIVFTTVLSKRSQTFVQFVQRKCWKLFLGRKKNLKIWNFKLVMSTYKSVWINKPTVPLKFLGILNPNFSFSKIFNLNPSKRTLLNWNSKFRSTGIFMPKPLINTKSNFRCLQAIQLPPKLSLTPGLYGQNVHRTSTGLIEKGSRFIFPVSSK